MSNKDIREQRATLKSVLQGPPGCKTLAKSYEDKYNKLYIDNKDTLYICCKICKELIKLDRQTSRRNIDNHYNKHTAGSAGSKRPASNQLALIPPKRLDQKSDELSATQKKAINDSLMRNVIAGCRVSYNAACSDHMKKFVIDILDGTLSRVRQS